MFTDLYERNFVVFNVRYPIVDFMMFMPLYFTDLLYKQIGDTAILYKDGIDPRASLIEFLDYAIKYQMDVLDQWSSVVDDVEADCRDELIARIEERQKEIERLKKSRLMVDEPLSEERVEYQHKGIDVEELVDG